MKHIVLALIMLFAMGCVEPTTVEVPFKEMMGDGMNSDTDVIRSDPSNDIVFTLVEDDGPEELWRVETTYKDDTGEYVVSVHFSEGVTPTEAAKQFFDEMLKYEKCGKEITDVL